MCVRLPFSAIDRERIAIWALLTRGPEWAILWLTRGLRWQRGSFHRLSFYFGWPMPHEVV